MESSSEITDLKKLLSDLKVALESRHMNDQDTQHRIRNMTEMLESGYVKDEETLHQQRLEATQAIGEAQHAAEEDRKAAAIELKQAAEKRQDIDNERKQVELEKDRLAAWKVELARQKQELTEQREKLKRETGDLEKERKDRELIGMHIELRGDIERLSGVVKAGSEQAIDALAKLISRIDAARAQASSPERRRKTPRSAGTPDRSPSSSLRSTLSPTPRRSPGDRNSSRPRAGPSSRRTLVQGGLLPLLPSIQPGSRNSLRDSASADSSSTTAPAGLDPQIGGSAQTGVPSSRRIDLAAAPLEVRKIWGQIDLSPELQHQELEVLLDLMKTRSTRKTAAHQTPLPLLEKAAKQGGCLVRSLKKLGSEPNQHPTKACGQCSRPNDLCVGVSYATDQEPGEYDGEGTETRWKVTKRAP